MEKKIVQVGENRIAVLQSDGVLITDAQDALDLMMTLHYEDDCDRFALNKEALSRDFFDLSTGLAGEVLQKLVQYSRKFAIIGDFSVYGSKSLHDLMYESNKGNDVFFVASEDEAVERLGAAR